VCWALDTGTNYDLTNILILQSLHPGIDIWISVPSKPAKHSKKDIGAFWPESSQIQLCLKSFRSLLLRSKLIPHKTSINCIQQANKISNLRIHQPQVRVEPRFPVLSHCLSQR
jgi:hypothetical protein